MLSVDNCPAYIVGLGNPGYTGTPHNMGFLFVELIASLYTNQTLVPSLSFSEKITIEGNAARLLQPKTYMNDSGHVLASALRKQKNFRLEHCNSLLVVADNVDIPPGTVKLRFNSGAAGHKGIKSVQKELGSTSFFTLWIGVGRSDELSNLSDYVLHKMSNEHLEICRMGMKQGISLLLRWLQDRNDL